MILGSRPQRSSAFWEVVLRKTEMRQSMSARANPYHNAWTESFIGKLKAEMLDGGCVINARDDRTEIFSYIESYYNVYCKHSALDYPTPAQLGSVQFSFLV
jgi:transposase InsO family protein